MYVVDENKRVSNDESDFKKWLLKVGDGIFSGNFEITNEVIKLPKEFLSTGDIITEVFGEKISPNDNEIHKKVILCPKNYDVMEINNEILSRLEGEQKEYISIDSAEDENNENYDTTLPVEFLNSLNPNGLPPHKLKLKIGMVVILLRNINLSNGLCNGTRLIITELKQYSIRAKIITGNNSGKIVLLPRINLSPSKEEIPFNMTRRQFPIRLGCALTINKSQGQSFEKVGIFLPSPVFSHGQLYVALSRVTSKHNLKILLTNGSKSICETNECPTNKTNNSEQEIFTKNVVYHEIFGPM